MTISTSDTNTINKVHLKAGQPKYSNFNYIIVLHAKMHISKTVSFLGSFPYLAIPFNFKLNFE